MSDQFCLVKLPLITICPFVFDSVWIVVNLPAYLLTVTCCICSAGLVKCGAREEATGQEGLANPWEAAFCLHVTSRLSLQIMLAEEVEVEADDREGLTEVLGRICQQNDEICYRSLYIVLAEERGVWWRTTRRGWRIV